MMQLGGGLLTDIEGGWTPLEKSADAIELE